jgi:hypothetical protein
MENPREEILALPEYPYLIFGDGCIAMVTMNKEGEDREGREICELMIVPEAFMRKMYNITKNQLNLNGAMPYAVLKKDLVPLNILNKAKERWMYLKNFDRKEMTIGNPSKLFRAQLEEKEKELWMLQGDNIYLSEQVILLRTSPGEVMAQGTEAIGKTIEPIIELLNAKKGREVGE